MLRNQSNPSLRSSPLVARGTYSPLPPRYSPIPAQRYWLTTASSTRSLAQFPQHRLSESADVALERVQSAEWCRRVGAHTEHIADGIAAVFERYQTPIGLLPKLLKLEPMHALEFIVDDSWSMSSACGRGTRWTEVHYRFIEMFDFLAFVPTPPIFLTFLNRSTVLRIDRTAGMSPTAFVQHVRTLIDTEFAVLPQENATTPLLAALRASFARHPRQHVARYLFCDGEPDGKETELAAIDKLVCNRIDPEHNPFTFLSCSDNNANIRWMKELEEKADYCAEYDDYIEEVAEMQGDQGLVLPFPYGMYVVAQLVGAMCPDDLDAMDESVPFSKHTLAQLLGTELADDAYRRYFDGFCAAQAARTIETASDELKRTFDWNPIYVQLRDVPAASGSIRRVQQFKQKLKELQLT